MTYRVFDTSINKLFGAYSTEEEAMTLVRTLVGANDDGYADDLAVGCERDDGSSTEALSGAALLARADEVLAKDDRDRDRSGEVVAPRRKRSGYGDSEGGMPLAAKGYSFARRAGGKVVDAAARKRGR